MVKFTKEEVQLCLSEERKDIIRTQEAELKAFQQKQKEDLAKYDNVREHEIEKLLSMFAKYNSTEVLEGNYFRVQSNLNCETNHQFITRIFALRDIIYKWNENAETYMFEERPETRIARMKKELENNKLALEKEIEEFESVKKKQKLN